MSRFFPLPSPSKTCVLPFNFVLERDPKNISYFQDDVENYTDQVLDFLLHDRHEYIQNLPVGWSVYSSYGFMYLFLCHSRFASQNQFIFRAKLFGGTCFLFASNMLCHKLFPMKISSLY